MRDTGSPVTLIADGEPVASRKKLKAQRQIGRRLTSMSQFPGS